MSSAKFCSRLGLALGLLLGAMLALSSAASAHGYSEQILHSYCKKSKCRDGGGPQSKPLLDAAGNLYVANATVLEFTRDESGNCSEKTLYAFCSRSNCRDGSRPSVSLIMDVSGNIYGATLVGGKHNTGLAFELLPDADRKKWAEKVLYDFCYPDGHGGCTIGSGTQWQVSGLTYAGAASGALYDGVSPLYGTTGHGGTGGYPGGTAFELTPGAKKWTEQVLYSFCSQSNCTDGAYPTAGVIVDGNGNLYGTTVDGGHGTGTLGTVFELSPSARRTRWTETVLHSFCSQTNCTDGEAPEGELVMDASGALFGTTTGGGSTMAGVIFKLMTDGVSSTETVLYNFCSRTQNRLDGGGPNSGLVLDASDNLFSAATYGGGNNGNDSIAGSGTLFELTRSKYSVLHRFCAKKFCNDGQFPLAGVILDGEGNLFGTTRSGGKGLLGSHGHAGGTVFQFAPKD